MGAGMFCDQKSYKFFVLHGRINGRTRECKLSLLKVREEKYKRDRGGPRWNLEAGRACFCSPGAFKT
jgi:hypothetical protein